ncbi:MAG: M20/M25/M40 family metallo-hydrolase [Bacillota bacterium]|nr:M20/M25/M40 family metallo-hydrolase [Bacillota bacterium]
MTRGLEEAFRYVDDSQERFIADLVELCRQPSVSTSGEGMAEMPEALTRMLGRYGFSVRVIPTGGYPIVYGEIDVGADRTLLCYKHYDVQPPDPLHQWDSPPFEPTLRDGKLYARGVADVKGGIASFLHAVDALRQGVGSIGVNLKFLIEGEEEVASRHLEEAVLGNKDLFSADVCIWENAFKDHQDRPMIRIGNKGMCYLELRARNLRIDHHSRWAAVLPSSAWDLVWALSSLKDRQEHVLVDGFYDGVRPVTPDEQRVLESLAMDAEPLKRESGASHLLNGAEGGRLAEMLYTRPTCNIAGMVAGYTGEGSKTVLPAEAVAKLDLRLVPDQDPVDIYNKVKRHLEERGFAGIEVRMLSATWPSKTPVSHPFVQLVLKAGEMAYGVQPVVEITSAGSGPRYVFSQWTDMPMVALGVGYAGSQNHAPNENIRIKDYLEGVKHLAATLYLYSRALTPHGEVRDSETGG